MKLNFKSSKGFLLRDVVIGGVLTFGVIALFILAITSISINYSRPDIVNDKFAANFNKLNTLTSGTNGIETSRSQMTDVNGMNLIGNFDIAFQSTWTVLNMGWETIDLYASMPANLISTFTFLPAEVVKTFIYILISLLVIVTIFTIISSITRGRL